MRSNTFNHCLIICSSLFLPVVTGNAVASEELDINVSLITIQNDLIAMETDSILGYFAPIKAIRK